MAFALKTPGVYLQDVATSAATALQTGVPAFVGFGSAIDEEGQEPREGKGRQPVVLEHAEELANRFKADEASYLAPAVAGFFANGGVRCYVVGAAPSSDALVGVVHLVDAINRVLPTLDVDLVAVPDALATPLTEEDAQEVQQALLHHCASEGNRLAVLDAPRGLDPSTSDPVTALADWRDDISHGSNPANGALYYPWIRTAASGSAVGGLVPSCGHVAGIYARSDARVGVFKAPANEEILGALDLEYLVDKAMQEELNPAGINCLRAFPGRGLRVWGGRTMSRDPAWCYTNVRRLVLTLTRWIERNMTWVPFEPNGPGLWLRIQRELKVQLEGLWRAGALTGTTADEAFYVKCDGDTNPMDQRELGQVTTEIGLAPAPPAEFIVVRVIHRAGSSEVS